MKLFYSPNACSLGIHLLLEEIGNPYTLEKVDFARPRNTSRPSPNLNPKSKVPLLLRDDGSDAHRIPGHRLLSGAQQPARPICCPHDLEQEVRALELLDYLIATVHMRGFTRIFRSSLFTPRPADEEKVKQAGRDIIIKGFEILEPVLGDQDYILGRILHRRRRPCSSWNTGPVIARQDNTAREFRGASGPACWPARPRSACWPPKVSPEWRSPATPFWFLRHGETDYNAAGLSPGRARHLR